MTSLDLQSRKHNFLTELSFLRRNAVKTAHGKKHSAESGHTSDQRDNAEDKLPWFENYGAVITRYLQQVHSIQTIKGLTEKLNDANSYHCISENNQDLSFRTLDSIVKACEKWKSYLQDEEAFHRLVCIEAISMVKIHASVIAGRNFKNFQGAAGVRLKEGIEVPYLFTTVVSYHGLLQTFS